MPAWPERTGPCPDSMHESTAAEFHRAMLCLWTDAVRAYRVTTYTLFVAPVIVTLASGCSVLLMRNTSICAALETPTRRRLSVVCYAHLG